MAGIRGKLSDPMLFINERNDRLVVRIHGYDREYIGEQSFYRCVYKRKSQMIKAAQEYRDSVLNYLEEQGKFSLFWNPRFKLFIRGIAFTGEGKRLVLYTRDVNQKRIAGYYVNAHGLRGAFDKCVKDLEKKRRKKTYPEWVIDKGWKAVKKVYQEKVGINEKKNTM